MKAFIVQFPFGILAFDEENKLIEKTLFSKKPQVAAKTLLRIEAGKISDNIIALINQIKEAGYTTFVFDNGNLAAEAQTRVIVLISKPPHPDVAGRLVIRAPDQGWIQAPDGIQRGANRRAPVARVIHGV